MEKRLTTKVKVWTSDFKNDIVNKLQHINSINESDKLELLEYIYSYGHIEKKKVMISVEHILKELHMA